MRPVTDEQLMLSRRLCRDAPLGCWIGVRASAGDRFDWAAPLGESEQPRLLRGWARREPRSFTVDGREEACIMIPAFGADIPTGDELHTWKSARCDEERPFICERAARTTRFTLTVTNDTHITGGGLRGAGVLKANGSLVADGDRVELRDGATLLLGPGTSGEWCVLELRGTAAAWADWSRFSIQQAHKSYGPLVRSAVRAARKQLVGNDCCGSAV